MVLRREKFSTSDVNYNDKDDTRDKLQSRSALLTVESKEVGLLSTLSSGQSKSLIKSRIILPDGSCLYHPSLPALIGRINP